MTEAVGTKRSNEGANSWSGGKKSRGEDTLTLRFLLYSKHAGGIIGKGGETIKRLRSEFSSQVFVPDNSGNERVVSIGAERDNAISVLKECLPLMHEPPYPVNNGGPGSGREMKQNVYEVDFLVHSSQVGGIIGKSGARIKQMREETNAGIKVYPDPLPGCKERVVAIGGNGDEIVAALEQILDVMVEQPIKGEVVLYDPSFSAEGYDDNYGYNENYNGGGGMGGSMRGGNQMGGGGGMGQGPPGGNFGGGPQGGYGGGPQNYGNSYGGNNFSNYNNNQGPQQGGFGGGGGGGAGGNFNNGAGGNFGGGGGGGGGAGSGNQGNPTSTSTQVTIPNDMAGAIIGQGGRRIQEIRQKCGAQIKFADPEPGKKDRLITITGSEEQIQYAQYLMQQCVLTNSNSNQHT